MKKSNNIKISIYNNKVIIENYNKIIDLNNDKIIIDNYIITGLNLKIINIDEYYIIINGDIRNLNILEGTKWNIMFPLQKII